MEHSKTRGLSKEAENVTIYTGNLLNYETLKRKASIQPLDEISESVSLVLSNWEKALSESSDRKSVTINPAGREQIADRQSNKITVKVFTFDSDNCKAFNEAVDVVLSQLQISTIDLVILSLPPNTQKLTIDQIKPHWKCAEKLVSDGKAVSVGVSDLDTEQLIQLHQCAEVKPAANQINLDVCCTIPPEMSSFSKENNIQLLTHNDPRDFIPQETLEKLLSDVAETPASWERHWMVKYSVVVTSKGIIHNKGYILSTKKKSKK